MSQKINGDNNIQAGRDIIIKESHKINFYEGDLVEVIDVFSEIFPSVCSEVFDLKRIDIESKNTKNKLSIDYFKHMNNEYLPHFNKVDSFLRNKYNAAYLKRYTDTCSNINTYMKANRDKVGNFEEFFPILSASLLDKGKIKSSFNEFLFILLFHYMYWNCDIGEK